MLFVLNIFQSLIFRCELLQGGYIYTCQRWAARSWDLNRNFDRSKCQVISRTLSYCCWKKSFTTWHVWNPENIGIFSLYIHWLAGFFSTGWLRYDHSLQSVSSLERLRDSKHPNFSFRPRDSPGGFCVRVCEMEWGLWSLDDPALKETWQHRPGKCRHVCTSAYFLSESSHQQICNVKCLLCIIINHIYV